MATKASRDTFGPELFAFLADLRANNDREWFAANKHRYEEHLLEPALDFIDEFAPQLEKISPHFRADPRPSGGSLFRIYRDTRFSKDKTPYKTNVGIHFRHERAKDAHAPGLLPAPRPGRGVRRRRDLASRTRSGDADPRGDRRRPRALAARDAHRRVREAARARRRLAQARPAGPTRTTRSRTTCSGRTSSAGRASSEADVVAPGFVDEYARICRAAAPLMHFLCDALDVPF